MKEEPYYHKIANVVAFAVLYLDEGLDLEKLYSDLWETGKVIYKPEQFPGLVYHVKEPKATGLIFKTGKIVCLGCKSERDARRSVQKIVEEIEYKCGIKIGTPDVAITNVVASGSFKHRIDLEDAQLVLRGCGYRNVMYEPEQFPGLEFKLEDSNATILLFSNGKFVITGARSEEEVYHIAEDLYKNLEEENQLI